MAVDLNIESEFSLFFHVLQQTLEFMWHMWKKIQEDEWEVLVLTYLLPLVLIEEKMWPVAIPPLFSHCKDGGKSPKIVFES